MKSFEPIYHTWWYYRNENYPYKDRWVTSDRRGYKTCKEAENEKTRLKKQLKIPDDEIIITKTEIIK